MNDRELLELAARAAGVRYEDFDDDRGCDIWWLPDLSRYDAWNPLTDDGAALRLAVALRMDVTFDASGAGEKVVCLAICPETFMCCGSDELLGDDPVVATRRAIVRAAAEIGRAMV